MIPSCDLATILLCGGQSRRFGAEDKALAVLGGRTLLDRVLDAAGARSDEIVLAVGPAPRYAELSIATALDAAPDLGPLGGISAGLAMVRSPWVLLAAVDLPLITPPAIDRLIAAIGGAEYVIPKTTAGLEPLFSLGRRDRLRSAVGALLAEGHRAPRLLAGRLVTVELPTPVLATAPGDPLARAVFNVNDPADFERAARLTGAAPGRGEAPPRS